MTKMHRLGGFLYLVSGLVYIALILVFPARLWAVYTVTVEVQEDGKSFSIRSTGKQHKHGEKIVIDFEVKNRSDQKFFIFDLNESQEYPAYVDESSKKIWCWFGGDFDAKFKTYHKLRIVDLGDSLKFKIVIKTDRIKEITWAYDFHIEFGYLNFDEDLMYLTQVEPFSEDLVELRDEEDLVKLASLHKGLFIGKLPIAIVK